MHHSDFVHLHVHSQYSLLDGAIRLSDLIARAKEFRMPAVAVTDHGNMFGAIEFYESANKNGIKPIIGCEVYLAPGSRLDKGSIKGKSESMYHLVLLAKNHAGYQNLMKLISLGYTEGFYYKPRVDKELLKKHSEGLIAMSSCLKGEIPYMLTRGEAKKAYAAAEEFTSIFPDRRFYLEIQENGIPEQSTANRALMKLAADLQVPLVATNDCHYLKQEDARAHEVLLCIQTGKTMKDADRMVFSTNQFYLKSPQEMKEAFSYCPEAISNTIEIAERCNLKLELGKYHLPQYHLPEGYSEIDQYFEKQVREGMDRRFAEMHLTESALEQYRSRLDEEIEMIRKMKFSGYFLIVADFINYAKQKNIPVGPGRGSAAGSLVAYALNITDIDPIPYNLLFERFLNPERISMPDIDIDFCIEGREDVIRYVKEKYGKDNVSQIITFGTMKAKAAVRDVGRSLDIPYSEVDKIAKLIPNSPQGITIEKALKAEPRLAELYKSSPQVKELLDIARSLEGLTRHASTHAAGVVIANRPLYEYTPLFVQDEEVTTQYDMKSIEKLGLIKFDFLGLQTLTVIDHALNLIRTTTGQHIDLIKLPLDNKLAYELLSSGNTSGVFQLESSGMKNLLTQFKPTMFEDIIALIALYRPGPMNMIPEYIKRKKGELPINYELPALENVLKETYGVMVYQEQVMQISQMVAGYSLGEADILRRAMGKKMPEEMAKQKEKFIEGARHKKISQSKAVKIFDLMAKFAEYGFNKSHSAAYALIAYHTAYLKSHFPVEFMAALLTSEVSDSDKIVKYMGECRGQGINVLAPDVNESHRDFSIMEGKIRFGLEAVKGVGGAAADLIISERTQGGRFDSLVEFCERIDLRKVNRKVMESLIKCGAFDSTGAKRSQMMEGLDMAMEIGQSLQKDKGIGQMGLFGGKALPATSVRFRLPDISEWADNILLANEKDALGFFLTGHPLARFGDDIKKVSNTNTAGLADMPDGSEVRICGMVNSVKEINTKKGERMAFISLEDMEGFAEVIVFSDIFKKVSHLFSGDEPVYVKGVLDLGEENREENIEDGASKKAVQKGIKIVASEIISLTQAKERMIQAVRFRLNSVGLTRDQLQNLKDLFEMHEGNCKAYLHISFPSEKDRIILLHERILPSPALEEEVSRLMGYKVMEIE